MSVAYTDCMRIILDESQVNQRMSSLSKERAMLFDTLRNLILNNDPGVSERIEQGKWLSGYLKYDSPNGNFVYALGVKSSGKISLHIMTYYGSKDLQQKYGKYLEPYSAGKSCFDFGSSTPLPIGTLKSIFTNGSKHLDDFVSRWKADKR